MEVAELEGVQSVEASADEKTATITFTQPATEDSIKAFLTEINYPARS
jgi:copper chaperone CopZ